MNPTPPEISPRASRARQIEELFYAQIPITRAMGVKVEEYDQERLILRAPLEANVNHLGTAFGGSINAAAVLAGYALLWLEMRGTKCHIVIRESSISYERPVENDIRAVCARPDEGVLAKFKRSFHERGKAHIELAVTVESSGVTAARFRGRFVALR